MLEVKELHKYYGAFHAVRGVTFGVDRGEIVGFLGPNGAGKTTTMKIVVGFMSMSSGGVRVDGHDVVEDSMTVRRNIGYLPENAPLYEDMTVSEYLAFIADMRGLRGRERKERTDYVVGVCSLEPKRTSGIKTLSKGYRQRVGLAQAIIHDPKMVILDEPTVGLDPNQIIEIRRLIQEIGARNTVILSSHILSEVEATCGRVVIINEGEIVANGAAHDLESAKGGGDRLKLALGTREDCRDVLAAVDGVRAVEVLGPDGESTRFILRVDSAVTAAPAVARAVSERGWQLYELEQPRRTLEDVFKDLTGGRGAEYSQPIRQLSERAGEEHTFAAETTMKTEQPVDGESVEPGDGDEGGEGR